MTCPDLLVLSQLLDAELKPDEAREVEAHTRDCAECRARSARMARAQLLASRALARDAIRRGETSAPSGAECLSPNQLSIWLDPASPPKERGALNQHLESCDACLTEVLAARRVLARLDAGRSLAVPAVLRDRVASRWPTPARPTLSNFVVHITRAGAALVERHVRAPLLDVLDLPAPEPALRAGVVTSPLQFQISAPAADIRATVLPADDAVVVTLLLTGKTGQALPDQRVSVRRHARSIFSARTDQRGELRLPSLERGVYEVSCPGIQTEFRLDLRGE